VDGALFLNDTSLDVLGRIRAGMALEETDPFHDNPVLAAENAQDPTYFGDVFPRDHFHLIVLSKLNRNGFSHVK
jgi:hypothetical protein